MRKLEYIWSINENKLSRPRRWTLRALKRCVITVECILQNNIMSFASALTYSSMLAAVPILAIVFAVARGFGFETIIEEKLRSSLEVNPSLADAIMHFVDSYLQHTKSGVFIGVGLIFLLYSLTSLTISIEAAFNAIWHVPRSRAIHRQVANYIGVFVLLPFVILIGIGLSFFLQTIHHLLPGYQLLSSTLMTVVQITPSVLTCMVFVVLYKLMPNTQVKFRSAFWPGVGAGICFIVLQYVYIHYQIKLSAYNAIYGTFAALPLLMLWLQISWCICLIGGQLCYANQSLDHYAFERTTYSLSRRYRDTICLLLLCRICKRFAAGSLPYSQRTLAKDCDLPETLVQSMLNDLVNMQLLAETRNESGTTVYFLPAVDIHHMTVQMVMRRMDSYGTENAARVWQANTAEWNKLRNLRNEYQNELLINL